MSLPGHTSTVWNLCSSSNGSVVYSGGGDRSIRRWCRGSDMVFIDEEKVSVVWCGVCFSVVVVWWCGGV